ncbi:MAG: hypothetical protein MK085_13865, partial [Phycisphaerales bacterium]|nr:hypothetical protein [Phycisphaerales bacterium]
QRRGADPMSRWHAAWLVVVALALGGCGNGGESPSPVVDASAESGPGSWREKETADGNFRIRWRPLVDPIPVADVFSVEVEVEGVQRDLDGITVLVDAEMPHHGHGMNLVPELIGGPGEWTARGILFHMPGRWEFSVDVLFDGRMERAQWTVDVE